ncbi:chemotaxis protein CheD [Rugamonas apoptosis]|uniref:Probable chemoreceptor glutamine deamidase CheD n=1 Tax=Rugamonas apoptosis TaxID=2758570 RepID=A0A7W2F5R3_9BURK|nr:chemotaxis protein CheD [Rugamonas apoptosis]MBA5685625.1 chemotaxis protein CheD [Rugamonas apoptosis]
MPEAKCIDIFLMPGDCFVGDEQYRVRTLVGSCVSVTLWHPRLRVGAMSHFLLPGSNRKRDKPGPAGTYGADAMDYLLAELDRLGVPLTQCEGKIFGGGAMFPRHARVKDIGMQNGDCARDLMRQHGIRIVSESLFGEGHRQLIFTIRTGEVLSRQVPPEFALHPQPRNKEQA